MDDALTTLILRFATDLVTITLLVSLIYFGNQRNKEYAFTFYLFNVLIFFVCYVMQKSEISMGFAFGLFAIFGILRYRTITVPIKEMTYLFTAITIALINGIGHFDATLFVMNGLIVVFVFLMEKIWFTNRESSKVVQFEKIELIENGKTEEILQDISRRTGLNIIRYEVKSMNFLNDSAELKVYYIPK